MGWFDSLEHRSVAGVPQGNWGTQGATSNEGGMKSIVAITL